MIRNFKRIEKIKLPNDYTKHIVELDQSILRDDLKLVGKYIEIGSKNFKIKQVESFAKTYLPVKTPIGIVVDQPTTKRFETRLNLRINI